jgi:hypothetical protein
LPRRTKTTGVPLASAGSMCSGSVTAAQHGLAAIRAMNVAASGGE